MRRYSARQSVSFGRSDEYARRRQGIIIAVLAGVLAAGLLAYFLILAPTMTNKGGLQVRYREAMQAEIKQANSIAASNAFSATGGWGEGYRAAQTIRSNLYSVTVLYKLYLEDGGKEINGFSTINNLIGVVDEYVDELKSGGANTTVIVSDVRNQIMSLNDSIQREIGD